MKENALKDELLEKVAGGTDKNDMLDAIDAFMKTLSDPPATKKEMAACVAIKNTLIKQGIAKAKSDLAFFLSDYPRLEPISELLTY